MPLLKCGSGGVNRRHGEGDGLVIGEPETRT